jgi:hypothetical protein
MNITNDKITLLIETCNDKKITFILKSKSLASDKRFDFDFRYYTPYHDGNLKRSGVYVFKTGDNDSTPYNHAISQI